MNAFKQLLQQPRRPDEDRPRASHLRVPLGTWLMSASPIVAEALGHAGFDWAVLDMEHSPLEVPGVLSMLQALSTTKLAPVVRVPSNDPVVIKRVLDLGATTLMVPLVQDAEEAARAVASTPSTAAMSSSASSARGVSICTISARPASAACVSSLCVP